MWHDVLWQSRVPFFSPSACTVQGMHTSVCHQEHKCDWLHTWSLFHEASTHSGFPVPPILRAHSDAPHLPGLLQLGCPPLLQDGLNSTDEFHSYVLEEKKKIMWDADCAAVSLHCCHWQRVWVCGFTPFVAYIISLSEQWRATILWLKIKHVSCPLNKAASLKTDYAHTSVWFMGVLHCNT